MNINKQELEQLLTSNHIVIPREQAVKQFSLDLENYEGSKVALYKYNGSYQWTVFNNNNDWTDIIEYGSSEDIEEFLNSEEIDYFIGHTELFKENNW